MRPEGGGEEVCVREGEGGERGEKGEQMRNIHLVRDTKTHKFAFLFTEPQWRNVYFLPKLNGWAAKSTQALTDTHVTD